MDRLLLSALIGALVTATGCSTTTHYTTTTTLYVNQVKDLWRDTRYRYVTTGLTASAHAPVDSVESTHLASRAMDALVQKAALGPNRALTDVTMEEGTIDEPGKPPVRVVTLRGDVVELLREPR